MNYELAKKLKDAGFPQIEQTYSLWIDKDGIYTYQLDKVEGYEYVLVPDLKELIEACGEDFDYLKRMPGGKEWNCDAYSRNGQTYPVHGSTSSETVANLWLALRKNNTTIEPINP